MCGLAGYVSARDWPDGVLAGMTERLAHRGPDAQSLYACGPARLGHRRLSIIDVLGSPQPLFNEDQTVAVVFNGEIYNFRELRAELKACGHRFRTQGDGEVIAHGYEEYGPAVLDRLAGMFALALWDAPRQRLLLARDHLGVKPLYYAWDGTTLVFGSELKSVTAHPAVSTDLDLGALALYLEAQYIPAPTSVCREVRKLPAGHCLTLERGELTVRGYWRPDYRDKLALSMPEAVDYVGAELKKSVAGMLVADVPLGAFVSGGVDSSLIAALMTELSGRAVDTFNIGFAGGLASEHAEAALVARHLGARHHCLMVEPGMVLQAFEGWSEVFDEPFGDQAALPTLLLARFTRPHVKVVLTGEGADEVFSGYGNYYKRAREERLTRWLGAAGSPLPALVRRLPARLRKDRLLKAITRPLARRYVTIPSLFDEVLRPALFSPAFAANLSGSLADSAERLFHECNSAHYLDKLMYIDTRLWLPDDLLTKVDRATMAHSLEARVPYLDHRFVQACARLDPALKQHGRVGKFVLKELARRHLPGSIVDRPKQGFFMPLKEWLARELRPALGEALSDAGLLGRNLLRPEAVRRLLAEHDAGRKNHAIRLWSLLVLELWFRRHRPDFRLS